MHFQLLRKPERQGDLRYRGIQRQGPQYDEALPVDSLRNKAWADFVGLDEKLGSPEEALRFASIVDPLAQYDVVGIEPLEAAPGHDDRLMGFDVAAKNWNSMLVWGISWGPDRKTETPLGPMLELLEAHFRPLLNEHGLFADYATADLFRRVLQAYQALMPNMWEAPGHFSPAVIGVYAIRL